MHPRHLTHAAMVAAVALAGTIVLAGCGGSSSSSSQSTRSQAVVTITWPSSSSRLIPAACNSIVVKFRNSSSTVATQTATRPTSGSTTTLTFDSLPVGTLTAQADAYPNSDGTGVVQASATTSVEIVSGQVTPVTLTMASTIDHLTISPTSPAVTAGATTTLSATAYDASGNVVLVASSAISWASGSEGVATVTSAGVVTGVAQGTASITVTDSESGVSASVTVTVNPAVEVTISPSAPSVSINGTQAFTATVKYATDTSVTWSVKEGSTGGTITSAGVYTAPSTAGTYHVIATSVEDTTKSATAEVTVQSGGASVVVQ